MTELDTALTFLAVAATTSSTETRDRNRRNACEAYRTVLRMQSKVVMDPRQKNEFHQKFTDLKKRLKELGLEIPEN